MPLSGTVTNDGDTVSGVKVVIIDSDNDEVLGSTTTDSNGNWSYIPPANTTAHILFIYDDGTTKYAGPSKPYVDITSEDGVFGQTSWGRSNWK